MVREIGNVSPYDDQFLEWASNAAENPIPLNFSDNSGNKAEAEVSVNNDGSGSASISVSHDENSDS